MRTRVPVPPGTNKRVLRPRVPRVLDTPVPYAYPQIVPVGRYPGVLSNSEGTRVPGYKVQGTGTGRTARVSFFRPRAKKIATRVPGYPVFLLVLVLTPGTSRLCTCCAHQESRLRIPFGTFFGRPSKKNRGKVGCCNLKSRLNAQILTY